MLDIISSFGAGDIIALALIGLAVYAALRYMKKSRKKGGCSGCCGGCAFAEKCQKKDNENE